jgi:2-keto-3-deoxy-L-rhamnonate aldolase RhmA
MENAQKFKDKLIRRQVCLGTAITFTDPTVTEALSSFLDFVWIDMEHNALSLETVQGHIMSTKGTDAAPLVRVPWNDPVLIKPVLDIGAAGVIVPMVRTAEEARRAVEACRYPPEGVRGIGPRRPYYGQIDFREFCRKANATLLTILQIEHIDAVHNLDEILAVAGVSSLVLGPMDLSASMGHTGEPQHPDVLRAIDTVISKARRSQIPVGVGSADDPKILVQWVEKGIQWLQMGNDYTLMLKAVQQVSSHVREALSSARG